MPDVEKLLWESLLTADMSARYWGYLARRFRSREMCIKIFLAVTSSGTVAGWVLWKNVPVLWEVLSGISAVLAVALPILNYPERIETMAELRAKWTRLRVGYEALWAGLNAESQSCVEPGFRTLKETEPEISRLEATLPQDLELIRICQGEVARSRGLPTSRQPPNDA